MAMEKNVLNWTEPKRENCKISRNEGKVAPTEDAGLKRIKF